MSEELGEWIGKAEGDYFSALREYRARKNANYDSACFHAQQCVEKYPKAILVDHSVPFAKTHDLLPLLALCLPYHALWQSWHDDVEWLSQYAVLFRYPGESATHADAKKAIGTMKRLCPDLRHALRLKSHVDG
jgi:HEPN domain-containing protein